MVAPPQHCLYFFPEPHGQGEFLPTLGTLCRGSLVWALGLTCRCDRKIPVSARKPSRHVHDDFFELSGLIGLGRISGSSSCSWQSIIVGTRSAALLVVDKLSPAVVARTRAPHEAASTVVALCHAVLVLQGGMVGGGRSPNPTMPVPADSGRRGASGSMSL
jgi:hypothetical protein